VIDAHNHLQDPRLAGQLDSVMAAVRHAGIRYLVVNGSAEEDWQDVLRLAHHYPEVIPCLGYHPWYVRERSTHWCERLEQLISDAPRPVGIGEIGLDRWIPDFDLPQQEEVFLWQLDYAAQNNLPASVHCLKAWGRLYDLLRDHARPACGFLLHSYGGPVEMIEPLARLGAFFSLPGYYAHPRKERQREAFRHVPPDRVLIETDAPDQVLPADRDRFHLTDPDGKIINHPANLAAVYQFASELFSEPLPQLQSRVETNFRRLFGPLLKNGN
jgi:TatD DNase family protein